MYIIIRDMLLKFTKIYHSWLNTNSKAATHNYAPVIVNVKPQGRALPSDF